MKNFSAVMSVTALAAGIGGGAVAYQSVNGSTPQPVAVAKTSVGPPTAQVLRPGVSFRWAKCKAPSVRVGKACVVDVVQTVVLPAAPAPAAAPAPSSSGSRHEGHEATHHESNEGDDSHDDSHEDGHESEDNGQDDGGEDAGNAPGDD